MKVAGFDKNRVLLWLVYANAFMMPLSSFVSARLLVVAVAFSLIIKGDYRQILRTSWDILIYITVLAIGLIYSADKATGFRVLETSFSLLVFPMIIGKLKGVTERQVEQILTSFIAGLLVAGVICVGHSAVTYAGNGQLLSFFSYNLTDFIGFHPTYFAYYLIFAISFGLYLIYYRFNTVPAMARLAAILFAFVLLVLTGGRTAFISLLLIFSFFVLKYVLEQRTMNKNLAFAAVVFMLVTLFAINSVESWNQSMIGDYWERSTLWISAVNANPNPVLGVGTGDYKVVLNEYYRTHGLESFAEESYNSHNQFIQMYFTNGLIGLLALLLVLGRPLYVSMRSDNALGILVFFPFMIYGMTEVFLGRYQGVVFFAMLHQLFMTAFYASRLVIAPKATSFS